MVFLPKYTDYALSPYTGLVRESWLEAGEYLLQGIFKNIKSFDAPVVMPRRETKITYPHLDFPRKAQEAEKRAEIFEGLARSMLIAAPMLHNKPELVVCGYRLKDYYKVQILNSCTRGSGSYVGTYEELREMTGSDSFRAYQQTVETCALVICLWTCREVIWDNFTKEEKDRIAAFLSGYAHASTVPQNWRLFNMLDLAFLHMNGYDIDREIMLDHAQAVLDYYVGDGWYRDGQSFDYYSCWAFNFYAPLWNVWYGYDNEPYLASKFEEYSNKLMETYGDFFDEEGWMNMWGRSNSYRCAAVSAFDGNLLLRDSKADPGLARRIASGCLMQFLGREDFLWEGIPTLGFYGQFAPLVQGYSCAESPFWLGKAFLCLHLPPEHPFWTAAENNGSWERLRSGEVKETVLSGPALCFTNHKSNGETLLRSGKIVKNAGDRHGMWNYARLCYNTKYPWESAPSKEVEAQQYVLYDMTEHNCSYANALFWGGVRDGVLYRRQYFDYRTDVELHWRQGLYLADFPVEYGILRVDKMKLHRRPVRFTLGAYGFPDNGTQTGELTREYFCKVRNEENIFECRTARAVILKGRDAAGREKQLAMTVYDGWDNIGRIHSTGTDPDSERSIILCASAEKKKQYGGGEQYVMISQVITKESHEDFSLEELFPIKAVRYADEAGCGTYGPVELELKNGEIKKVDYEGLEGNMSL